MANPMSTLGIIHTIISIAPIAAGLYAFVKYGAIPTGSRSGKLYLVTLALSAVTSFGLSSTGGFNPGHAIGIPALLAAAFALALDRVALFGRFTRYLQTFAMSFTFFLLMVPGINETLSRLPPSNPIGNGPESPVVQTTTAAWALIFLVGLCYQALSLRRSGSGAVAA